jgi:hypothetical protein
MLASNVSGASSALESLETSFHQDLNGDGVIGIPATKPAAWLSSSNEPAGAEPAVALSSYETFSFRQDIGTTTATANSLDAIGFRSLFSAHNEFSALFQQDRVQQPQNFSEAAHHDQAFNSGSWNDHFSTNFHLSDLLTSHFFSH